MFRPVIITPPVETPVSVADCKAHTIIDHAEDDALVDGFIRAATSHLDGFSGVLGRAIITQTWRVQRDAWARSFIIPLPNVSAVTVTYADADGAPQAWPGMQWLNAVATGTQVRLIGDFPTLEADNPAPISVEFTAGYGATADNVPWALRVAIMQMVAQMYEARTGEPQMGAMLYSLISPYRWHAV